MSTSTGPVQILTIILTEKIARKVDLLTDIEFGLDRRAVVEQLVEDALELYLVPVEVPTLDRRPGVEFPRAA